MIFCWDEAFLENSTDRFGNYRKINETAKDLDFGSLVYLQDGVVTLTFPAGGNGEEGATGRKLKIYGCPTAPLYGLSAFQIPRSNDIWSGKVPKDTDILLTHGPPYRHLDGGLFSGCQYLAKEITRVRPRLVFGHIHVGYGREDIVLDPVRAAYEGILGTRAAWPALFGMACRVLIARIISIADNRVTTIVNAAVVGGEKNKFAMEPTVIEIGAVSVQSF